MRIGDDFVPHLQPQGGVAVFASAFGCPVDFFDHTLAWEEPGKEEPDSLVEEMREVRKRARESFPRDPQYGKVDVPE